jgi:toxin HigB-1
VIRSFRNRALRRYFEASDPTVLNIGRVGRMLRALDAATPARATEPSEFLLAPAARRSPLEHPSQRNWRITFAWHAADAVAVDLEDYH